MSAKPLVEMSMGKAMNLRLARGDRRQRMIVCVREREFERGCLHVNNQSYKIISHSHRQKREREECARTQHPG